MPALIEETLPAVLAGKRPATVKQYLIAARRLQEILSEFDPAQVKPVHVAQIQTSFEATPAVANRTVTVLRLIFGRALKAGLIESNPCVGIEPMTIKARTREIGHTRRNPSYPVDSKQDSAACCPIRTDSAAGDLLSDGGLRFGEYWTAKSPAG